MNKAELISLAADHAYVSKKEAGQVLDAFLSVIVNAVAAGDKVTLVGFGTFEPVQRQPRQARNPRTGEKVSVPGSVVPKFTPGKGFKQEVANIGSL